MQCCVWPIKQVHPAQVTVPNWIALGQTVRDMYGDGDLPENWDPVFCLSRSLKVIGTDADRSATYDFLLTFHSNLGLISYHFHDTARCCRKSRIFPNPCLFELRVQGVIVGIFSTALWLEKARMIGLRSRSDVNKDWTCKDKDLTHKDFTYSYLLQVAAKSTIAINQQQWTQSENSQHMTVKPITLNK